MAIVTNCFLSFKDQTVNASIEYGTYKLLCVSENFDYRVPGKFVTSFSPNPNAKLVELLDSEVKALFGALKQFASTKKYFVSPIVSSRISFTFNQLIDVIIQLMECTSANVQTILMYGEHYALNVVHEILSEPGKREKTVLLATMLLSHCSGAAIEVLMSKKFPHFQSLKPRSMFY